LDIVTLLFLVFLVINHTFAQFIFLVTLFVKTLSATKNKLYYQKGYQAYMCIHVYWI